MKTIMVGVDGSAGSGVAFRTATDLAKLCDGVVYAVAVVPDSGPGEGAFDEHPGAETQVEEVVTGATSRWFEEALDACAEACSVAEVGFMRNVLIGDPARILTREAEGCDLLVVGSHGQTDSPNALVGNTTRRILRHSTKPMLVTRGEYKPISRVVVGYDGTADSGHAVEWVGDFGRMGEWQVCMVTGAPLGSALAEGTQRAARLLTVRGIEPDVHLVEGDAPGVIFDEAHACDADLIAIGATPKGPVTGFFIGEAWPDVVEQAKVPVLCWR